MVESSDEPSLLDRIRSLPRKTHASNRPDDPRLNLPLTYSPSPQNASSSTRPDGGNNVTFTPSIKLTNVPDNTSSALPPPAPPPPLEDQHGEASTTIEQDEEPNIVKRFYGTSKDILLSSWLNVLLVFVPVGIAVKAAGVNPTTVFAMNAIAIIPLAGMLSHATESVASRMGDTVGALMNVTFGNAVELIIFMYVQLTEIKTKKSQRMLILSASYAYSSHVRDYSIALVKNEIRIVQASLLGSILANLLLILGMCFLVGGLRFREQIYNSTVTQMSACLLSLSVMSLLLPTAFHASFTDNNMADKAVLKVSRGTSIILLLVYVLYLLFQLKSHAYMYESTPQHVIDEESHPGVLADMLNSSSSSDTSGSSGDSDTSGSSGSNTTAKRIKRVLRGRRRRKSSASSKDAPSMPSAIRTPSTGTFSNNFETNEGYSTEPVHDHVASPRRALGAIASGDEADTDGEHDGHSPWIRDTTVNFRDFENEKGPSGSKSPEQRLKKKSKKRRGKRSKQLEKQAEVSEKATSSNTVFNHVNETRPSTPHVGFEENVKAPPFDISPKRPFNIRGISIHPTVPKMLSSTVFSATNPTGLPAAGPLPSAVTPRAPYGLRRTSSLPDRLNQTQSALPAHISPYLKPVNASQLSLDSEESHKPKKLMSRTTAVLVLLISTGLVAVCAEFLVSSINYLVDNTSVSEVFVGLIILPIVGNAAEHVTAVTVASKNKMDLAIGVAVGSSIQIALFVTPVIVLLGWVLQKDMSLYFSLFETVSLFVSAFIVNFLVLDGRSNYLEGALLIAAYVIIAVAAFFYPDSGEQSTIGGAEDGTKLLKML